MKNIFPVTERIGKVWRNPYNGWLYEYKGKIKGWVCIKDCTEK
tara:strand:+ start:1282 stop:1410 length:129 start_codon:yes stop_codon:yes gene_type:complete